MSRKLIYRFGPNGAEGRAAWKNLLGGKGANLAEMSNLGIPVPPGFTITTEVCAAFTREGARPAGLEDAVRESLTWLEQETGRGFGDPDNPLLLSVRSGARVSMPGMMDTVLDLGLNPTSVEGLARRSGSPRFAYDAYRRFISMYGDVVLGIDRHLFDAALMAARRAYAEKEGVHGVEDETLERKFPDSVLPTEVLQTLVSDYRRIVEEQKGSPFPDDPLTQLLGAIDAVFHSWDNPRAEIYREMHDIPRSWGTAVNIQAMVFGNLGDSSATGVAFTRDPTTGEKTFWGEWLPNAQGEDVVAGVRTPMPLAAKPSAPGQSLEEMMPVAYKQLFEIQDKLEHHYRDMQDLEFTIEENKLWMLQTRNGKRTARAAVRIAVEMVREGLLHENEALMRVEAERLTELLFPGIDPKTDAKPIATGIAASPGAVTGALVFDADEAVRRAEAGEDVILARAETSPEDLSGMKVAKGILTARGGATSHAAVVARGMGRTCVSGASTLGVHEHDKELVAHAADGSVTVRLKEGDVVTLDGSRGLVYVGDVDKVAPALGGELETLLTWATKAHGLEVRANADTPEQAKTAREFGARGIGLCRTEHMFFSDERIGIVREMILAPDREHRIRALDRLLPFQTDDFAELFRAMDGLPVNIRLLDPPLHEFLPQEGAQLRAVATAMNVSEDTIRSKVNQLREFNPMLGHRGVRLAITYPEIARMQITAILTAASRVKSEGVSVFPEIMVPLAMSLDELRVMRGVFNEVKETIKKEHGSTVDAAFGTMIELPRAALMADSLAEEAEFFSFGTNDLTQTTFGLSRDDAGQFLPVYVEKHLLPRDPFASVDEDGVGKLVQLASESGRKTRPSIHLGVCGEHGGDPRSIEFFDRIGLEYVSCSPFRIPIARLASARAAIARQHLA